MLSRFLLALQPSAEAAFAAPAAGARTPQVLRLRDAVTDQEISLIGTIHYHPVSSVLVKDEITRGLKQHKRLGAVVLEADLFFWEAMLGDTDERNFANEMHTAAALALQNNFPIMLGDAELNHTMDMLKRVSIQTLRELVDPIGGWRSISSDLGNGWSSTFDNSDIAQSELLLDGEAPLSPSDYMQPEIFSGFWSFKFKKVLISFAVLLTAALSLDPIFDEALGVANVPLGQEFVLDLVLAPFLFPPFALVFRLFQGVLLDERNAAFAKSIRRAAAERNGPVVAAFGAAHINGVARLLLSKREPDFAGPDPGVWWEAPTDLNISAWR